MNSFELIIWLYLGGLGLSLVVVGSIRIRQTVLFIRYAYSTRDIIVHNRRELEGRGEGGGIVSYSRIKFRTWNGLVVEFEDMGVPETFLVRRKHKIGTEVPVLYDPIDPHNARWDAFHSL